MCTCCRYVLKKGSIKIKFATNVKFFELAFEF